jgi:hypothetical protein
METRILFAFLLGFSSVAQGFFALNDFTYDRRIQEGTSKGPFAKRIPKNVFLPLTLGLRALAVVIGVGSILVDNFGWKHRDTPMHYEKRLIIRSSLAFLVLFVSICGVDNM